MSSKISPTVIIALTANVVVAIAKSVAGLLTGSASMVAEAAHSWADTGNQVFLMIAETRGDRPADAEHPFGHGRETWIWSLFAAIGLFTVGAVVSVQHGIEALRHPEASSDFLVAYIVLGVSALLEGFSFLQALRSVKTGAAQARRTIRLQVLRTSDPTLRAVFFEDGAALIGLAIAAAGIALHQVTGSSVPDAIGSILVGVLLGGVALVLIDRNRRFLVGETVDPSVRERVQAELLALPDIDRVGFLRLEYVGPEEVLLIAAVDLAGNARESDIAETLHRLERRLEQDARVQTAMLTLMRPEDADVAPPSPS
jgi:cation diffusion facilitator family transporter